jgi:hypothetical protein
MISLTKVCLEVTNKKKKIREFVPLQNRGITPYPLTVPS